ncbi:MAG: ABC transporter permease [Anaerolineales bacterium]|nr:ABC transporter permease [Anaerolineales bacterium]
MALQKLWIMAFRDLGRNRRRTLLTMVGVSLGLALIIMMSGLIAGMLDSTLQDTIRLQTGHLQLRSVSYEETKSSLLADDLLADSEDLLAQLQARPEVESATAVLWASGILHTNQESTGLKIVGIDPSADFHRHLADGLQAGEFLSTDDRRGILISKRLGDSMNVRVGDRISLAVGTGEGEPEEGIYTVRGLFTTGFPGYDDSTVFLPLETLQSLTRVGSRTSSIIVMLHNRDDSEALATAVQVPGVVALTWFDLNSLMLETLELAQVFYNFMYGIVILIVAVIIANTLLMAVFERIREMGILAALGMKGRQIMTMLLFESAILALVGIMLGVVLGSALVIYLSNVGIPIGDAAASSAGSFTIGTVMYTKFVPADIFQLSAWMLGIILLVSIYPAWYAARLEPVRALHSL